MDDKERTVSAFEHENSLMHYGMVNKRSMIMLISVCVTFVLMMAVYEYLHKQQIGEAAEAKAMQSLYQEG